MTFRMKKNDFFLILEENSVFSYLKTESVCVLGIIQERKENNRFRFITCSELYTKQHFQYFESSFVLIL